MPIAYNPAFLSDEELVRSFVVRGVDLELLMESIRESTTRSNQHLLIVGARGLGKTTLALRAAAAVRADRKLAAAWYPLIFSEESYEVGTPGELWLEAIFHLGRQLDDERWRETYRELKSERDEKRLHERALAQLMDFADRAGKRLLVVIENLHLLLSEQLSPDDAWVLRHTLQNEPRILLLATATTRFEETDGFGRAMYELFRVQTLAPLDRDECAALWRALTGNFLAGNRIRPIQILTGGNPRLITILSSFAAGRSLRSLLDDLAHLVDEHTSYFKANLELLPAQERKVFVALADLWRPATAREVGEQARLEVSLSSALLHRLVRRGAVDEVATRGRTKRYQVAERLYNVYHLMRRDGRRTAPIRLIVEFMLGFYRPDELPEAVAGIAREALGSARRDGHFDVFLDLVDGVAVDLRRQIVALTPPEFFFLPDAPAAIRGLLEAASAPPAKVKPKGRPPTLAQLERRVARKPKDWAAWRDLGQERSRLQRWPEASAAFERAVALRPDVADLHMGLATTLMKQGDLAAAEELLTAAAPRFPSEPVITFMLALLRLGRDPALADEARAMVERALAALDGRLPAPVLGTALLAFSRLLLGAGLRDAAVPYVRRAKALLPSSAGALTEVVEVESLAGQFADAIESARRGLAIAPQHAPLHRELGFALAGVGQLEKALASLREAIRFGDLGAKGLLSLFLAVGGQRGEALALLDGPPDSLEGVGGREAVTALLAEATLGRWKHGGAAIRRFAPAGEEILRRVLMAAAEQALKSDQAPAMIAWLKTIPEAGPLSPVTVALQLLAGEEVNVPVEVLEVAKDLRDQLAANARTPKPLSTAARPAKRA